MIEVISMKSRVTSRPVIPASATRWCFWYVDASLVTVEEEVRHGVADRVRSYPVTIVAGKACDTSLDEEESAARMSAWWRGYTGVLVFVDSA